MVIIILSVFCVILAAFAVFETIRQKYHYKIAARLGLTAPGSGQGTDWAIEGWKNCLMKLDYTCDIAFLGDSLTRASDFGEFFKDKTICNLGLAGDTIFGIQKRVPMVGYVSPKKVFLLIGINSLRENNFEICLKDYHDLLDMLKNTVPNTEVYIQSILPIAARREHKWYGRGLCTNSTIRAFNEKLKTLASEKGMTYVDLYSAYEVNGELDPQCTKDGLHVYDHYEPWAKVIEPYIYNI